MIDWTGSMEQTFEFYEVDPASWNNVRRITNILSASIRRDSSMDTLETATFDTDSDYGEMYIRVYLVVHQNGTAERVPLGTFIVQTPNTSYDGKSKSISMDAYSPLLELKDNKPPIGFSLLKNTVIMPRAYDIVMDNLRAPVTEATGITDKLYDDYVSEIDESWLDFVIGLIDKANYDLALDDISRVLFAPRQEVAGMQPKWTFNDDNSSILYPSVTDDYDLYGIPNVVEVVYSGQDESGKTISLYSRAENNDANSITSIASRGRIILHRDTNPSISGVPTQGIIDHYAKQLLKDLNSIEHKISYSHGYCPVRVGDCVRLNYKRAGITDVKAKIISQNINCSSGCVVDETAVYTENLLE